MYLFILKSCAGRFSRRLAETGFMEACLCDIHKKQTYLTPSISSFAIMSYCDFVFLLINLISFH